MFLGSALTLRGRSGEVWPVIVPVALLAMLSVIVFGEATANR